MLLMKSYKPLVSLDQICVKHKEKKLLSVYFELFNSYQ